jgi:hypothetical protein
MPGDDIYGYTSYRCDSEYDNVSNHYETIVDSTVSLVRNESRIDVR